MNKNNKLVANEIITRNKFQLNRPKNSSSLYSWDYILLQKFLRLANLQLFARGRMLIARVVKCHDGQSANDGEIKRHMRICHTAISNSHFDLC